MLWRITITTRHENKRAFDLAEGGNKCLKCSCKEVLRDQVCGAKSKSKRPAASSSGGQSKAQRVEREAVTL